MIARLMRVALFVTAGVLLAVRSLQTFSDPAYQDPVTAADWFAVISFSAALLALALALPLFARLVVGTWAFRVSLVPAFGAALSGVANIFEDALHWAGPPGSSGWAFWLFVIGTATSFLGLLAFTIVVAVVERGRRRLIAAVPAATLIGLLGFESGGGVLVLVAWLVAAALVRAPRTHVAAFPEAATT